MKHYIRTSLTLCLFLTAAYGAEPATKHNELITNDVMSHFRETELWSVNGSISAVNDAFQLNPAKNDGSQLLLNGLKKQKAPHLFTKEEYSDASVHLEFMIPKGSNSGIYFLGRYEIQIFDSYGKAEVNFSDMGAVYQRWRSRNAAKKMNLPMGYEGVPPKINAAKAPGEWQTLDIIFRAPRFDADGKKVENARFISVHVNRELTQQNIEVTGPTRAAPLNGEVAQGPISIQGDHGPIAIRSFIVKPHFSSPDGTEPLPQP